MESHRLRILHISDLHERVVLDWMDDERKAKVRLGMASRHRVLASNFLDLLGEIGTTTQVDLVCFTGDVADWGLAEEYETATARFDGFLDALRVTRDRLFVVPGNHDVNREQEKTVWRKMRKLASEAEAELSNWMGGMKTPRGARAKWRDAVQERTRAFWTWLSDDLGRPELLPTAGPHGRLGYRCTRDDLGLPFPVHVIGFDSAWLCGDDNDAGKLLLTTGQADVLGNGIDGRPLPGFRLALVHHPLSDLADGTECFRRLTGSVDVLLHGHQHEPLAEVHSDPDRRLQVLAAGSLYEGDEGDRWINAFHIIDVHLSDKGRPLRYDLEFWGWSSRGHWYRTGAVYKEAPDGCLTLWTPLGKDLKAEEERERLAEDLRQKVQAPRVFIGRNPELDQLREALLDASPGTRTVAIGALQGMPGVGKSYLAEEFILKHLDDFPGGNVRIVLGPDDRRDADAICRDVCDQLSLATRGGVTPWEALGGRLAQPRSLLLIENVDGEPEAVTAAELIRGLGDVPTIVTGRLQGLGRDAGWRQVSVSPFDEEHALDQLITEWRAPGSDEEEGEFRRLVGTLGYLPLAIHLAAGYLQERAQTIDGFLALLQQRGLNVGPRDPADALNAEGARAILSETFDLSLGALQSALGADGERLLAALHCLGHAPLCGVGRGLGAAITGLDDAEFGYLAVEAVRLSLMECEAPPDHPRERFRVHPLLAELLKPRSSRDEALSRMTEWFVARLPQRPAGEEDEQGRCWLELHAELDAMAQWLRAVLPGDLRRVEQAGSRFADQCGPYRAWADLCERGLAQTDEPADRSDFLWTLSRVAQWAGDVDRVMEAAREKLELDKRREAPREAALAYGQIADILQARGELDEALRIRREEELPVYERLGDVRSRAVTMGQIADILQARGEVDEALRIRREQQLPVYERLGDVRSRAVTMGKTADVLATRGELDEALRIRREEQLPVYERLGDVRSCAATMSKIADILAARGELDEALRIWREQQLPVYERLGDVRSRAATMGKIADILWTRGELDEALRIRREEELPVYERLRDVRSRAVTMGRIADILAARGELDEALRIRREQQLPVYERLGDVRERAVTMGKIADILWARGELDEALRIRCEEELPVYDRLGDVRLLLVGRANLAIGLLERGAPGDRDEAKHLLRLALEPARRLGLPEARRIETILESLDQ